MLRCALGIIVNISYSNHGLNEDLDDRSIRVGMYFHYNLSKSAEEQSVIIDIIQDIINDENIPYIFKLYNIDMFIGKLKDLVDFKEIIILLPTITNLPFPKVTLIKYEVETLLYVVHDVPFVDIIAFFRPTATNFPLP